MTNHMAEVAKILGVELGEAFRVVDDNGDTYQGYCRITEENAIELKEDKDCEWYMAMPGILKWLLTGEARIVKLPWKPKYGDTYYMPYAGNDRIDSYLLGY